MAAGPCDEHYNSIMYKIRVVFEREHFVRTEN